MKITLNGEPISIRRNQQVLNNKGRAVLIPSKEYRDYKQGCIEQIRAQGAANVVTEAVNLRCTFFLKRYKYVSLNEMIESVCDILKEAGVIAGVHSGIIKATDYSRIEYDSLNPRAEIIITPMYEKEGEEWTL